MLVHLVTCCRTIKTRYHHRRTECYMVVCLVVRVSRQFTPYLNRGRTRAEYALYASLFNIRSSRQATKRLRPLAPSAVARLLCTSTQTTLTETFSLSSNNNKNFVLSGQFRLPYLRCS